MEQAAVFRRVRYALSSPAQEIRTSLPVSRGVIWSRIQRLPRRKLSDAGRRRCCSRRRALLVRNGRPPLFRIKSRRAFRKLTKTGWHDSARSIMTTDRFPKAAVRKVKIGNVEVSLAGIAKGSQMIAPDMGTMLCFLFTDAKLPAKVLQSCLKRAVDRSFNCISVDGDTSTSDTVLMSATGQVKRQPRVDRAGDPALRDFRSALEDMTRELALMIARDGAKSGRLLTCDVVGAESARGARNIGRSIVDSDAGACRDRRSRAARRTHCHGRRQSRRESGSRSARYRYR